MELDPNDPDINTGREPSQENPGYMSKPVPRPASRSSAVATRAADAAPSTTSGVGPGTPARRSRVNLACKRCKRRKQRCDGDSPTCRSCDRAGVECVYERTVRPQYPGGKSLYINTLEERIAYLEARLPGHAEDHYDTHWETPNDVHGNVPQSPLSSQSRRQSSCRHSQGGSISEDPEADERTSLVDGVAYLSLCASGTVDTVSEPFYVGSSSGATIARVIQSSIFRGSRKRTANHYVNAQTKQQPTLLEDPPRPPSDHFSDDSPGFPDRERARKLFDVFFERIHTRWPLLDRLVYTRLFEKQHSQDGLSVIERSIFHLIYAITARFLALTKKPCDVNAERHLVAATEPMAYVLDQHNLATVQFLLLLGVHGQRSPYGAGAWSQIRYASSVCIEMGLHRKRSSIVSPDHARETEIRRRAFWSCYCLDRVTSIVLGRPFAIADRDINAELPSTSPEFWTLTHAEVPDVNYARWSNIEPFVHIIKLDRIQSRIHKAVFRVDIDVFNSTLEQRTKLDKKMATIRDDLDAWLRSYPRTPKDGTKTTWMYDPESVYLDARDFYGVQYHKAMLFLLTVFLPTLDTSDARFITCARSAACVCTAYKRLDHNKTLTYTMISLHSCFVAGLTLVYCVWRDRSLFSYDALEATRACSQILTIFGEKWPGAVKYRDIFDAVSGSLFKTIVSPIPASQTHGNRPLHIDLETSPSMASPRPQAPQESHVRAAPEPVRSQKPTMAHMVSDAVKEAFMEVDEEAPGGWQGWRMWNEMVRDEETSASGTTARHDVLGEGGAQTDWNDFLGSGFYSVDPVQDAAMQMGASGTIDEDQWAFGAY